MVVSVQIVLIGLITAAGFSDLRARRIPNWIPVTGAVLGFALQIWYSGLHGGLTSFGGAALGLGMFLPLYMLGGMGAGDVKLFSAVGALIGPQALIIVFVFTGLLGGIAAIVLALSRGRLRETLERTGSLMLGVRAAAGPDSLRLPYGAVIAGGTLLSLAVLR
jgi:prepilin peptidase CpaA